MPFWLIRAAISPATRGVENDVPLHLASPGELALVADVRRLVAEERAGGVGVDQVGAERVDVDPAAEVGVVGTRAVRVERTDRDRPGECRRPERQPVRVVAGRGDEDGALLVAQPLLPEHLEAQQRQLAARRAAGGERDDVRAQRPAPRRAGSPSRTRRPHRRVGRKPSTRIFAAGAWVRTTPAMNVPWPAYGWMWFEVDRLGVTVTPSSHGDTGSVAAAGHQPVSTTETNTSVPAPVSLVMGGYGAGASPSSSGSVAGHSVPPRRDDEEDVVGRGDADARARGRPASR